MLTQRELLKQWFPCDVEGTWEVGAPLRFVFLHGEGASLSDEEQRGEVVTVDEPWLLEFRWGRQLMRYELQAEEGGCRFRLSEHVADPSWGARNAAGWEMCLDNLSLIVEGAAVIKFAAEIWQSKFRHYVRKFQPTFGPQHDPTGEHPLLSDDAPGDPS